MIYFDAHCRVGNQGPKHPRQIWQTESVLEEMNLAHIDAALVTSSWSREYSPNYGNRRLLDELAKSDRLYGCYTILPNIIDDSLEPAEMLAFMRQHRFIAAKIFPLLHQFAPDERTMGRYYRALEESGIPLLVEMNQLTFPELEDILRHHPRLNLIAIGVYWSQARQIIPLLDAYPNLHIDFSFLQANAIVERLVQRLGSKRFVFGSGLPHMSPGAARAFIDYADIGPEEKADIAHGNLMRLCNISHLCEFRREPADPLVAAALAGQPLPCPVFDSHSHIHGDPYECGGPHMMLKGDLAHMTRLYHRLGVQRYCVAPWLGIWADKKAGNNAVLEMSRQQPDAAFGLIMIDPTYDPDVRAQAEYYHLQKRVPGLKTLYARSAVRYNDPVFDPWWQIANQNKLFALMDYGSYPQFLDDMADLAERYPDIAFFLDHAGRDWSAAEANAALAKRYSNLYIQHTYTSNTQGAIEYFVAEGLADRTLFGTDAPMRDPRPQLGWIVYADISEADKRKILHENMDRLLARAFT